MEFTAKQIAQFVQGTIEGDENASVHTFSKIEEGTAGSISFLANPKYIHYLYDTKSTIVLVDSQISIDRPVAPHAHSRRQRTRLRSPVITALRGSQAQEAWHRSPGLRIA